MQNRLSEAQSITPPSQQNPYGNENYVPPEEEAARNQGKSRSTGESSAQKPSLRLTGKSPPSDLNVTCKFAVGKALELERALSAADDPRESKWKDDYCKWRKEAKDENCQVPSDTYYYENLCAYGW